MRIVQNVTGYIMHRHLQRATTRLARTAEKLNSGRRINRAGDDAARAAVVERMRARVLGLEQGIKNAFDGFGLLDVAEAGLMEVHAMLQRMRVLAIQAANATYSDSDRELMQLEVNQLLESIDAVTSSAIFNTKRVLRIYDAPASIAIHVGPAAYEVFYTNIKKVTKETLGIPTLDISTQDAAEEAIEKLDGALNIVSKVRAKIGADMYCLGAERNPRMVILEAEMASETRMRDTDFAKESSNLVREQIILQAGTRMMRYAVQLPSFVLDIIA